MTFLITSALEMVPTSVNDGLYARIVSLQLDQEVVGGHT